MKIQVKVKSNSNEDGVEKLENGHYLVKVKAEAREGKANLVVRKLLAKELGVSSKDILIKTAKGREKVVELPNFVIPRIRKQVKI